MANEQGPVTRTEVAFLSMVVWLAMWIVVYVVSSCMDSDPDTLRRELDAMQTQVAEVSNERR